MSGVAKFILTIDRDVDEAQKIVQHTAKKLETNEVSLLSVVESLGDYLNHEESLMRSKAVLYLSRTIGCLQTKFLTRQQLQVLCQFLCDRIKDDEDFTGLRTILSLPRFNAEMSVAVFRAMIESPLTIPRNGQRICKDMILEFHLRGDSLIMNFSDLQARSQSQRLQVLTMLNTLIANWRQPIRRLESESLIGITDLVNGEKDPRNLMIIFSILNVVIVEWDIRQYSETLFDAVFCYFPITFRPPPSDPFGITAEDLKCRLRRCIAASPYLAPYAFPQLIEKLDSGSQNVKRDVLDTIVACVKNYDTITVSDYSIAIWDAVRYEVFNAQQDDIAPEAIATIASVTVALDAESQLQRPAEILASYLRLLIKECNEHLREPQHKQAKVAASVLEACIESSPRNLNIIAKKGLPEILDFFYNAKSSETQCAALESILVLLSAVSRSIRSFSHMLSGRNPLDSLKDKLFKNLQHLLTMASHAEVPLRVIAMKCLATLSTMPQYFDLGEVQAVVQHLTDIVSENFGNRNNTDANTAIECLIHISKAKASPIIDITFPSFMAKLPETPQAAGTYAPVLESLARISTEKPISDTLIRRVLSRLDPALQVRGSASYCRALLSTLTYSLLQRQLLNEFDLRNYLARVFNLIVKSSKQSQEQDAGSPLCEPEVLDMLGRLSCVILRKLNLQEQRNVCAQAYHLFCPQYQNINIRPQYYPYAQRCTIMLSTYLIAATKEISLPIPTEQQPQLLDNLIELAIKEKDPWIQRSTLQYIGLVANKFASHATTEWLQNLLRSQGGLLDLTTLSVAKLRVASWISKALVIRLVSVEEILLRHFETLVHPELGSAAARAFSLFLSKDEILTRDNNAQIRLLAPQRIFQICVSVISRDLQLANTTMRSNYLVALSGMLKVIETNIIILETERILPLLLQALDLPQWDVKITVTETLEIIVTKEPIAVENHASNIISKLLRAAATKEHSVQMLRFVSLRCLREFPGRIRDSILLPYRQQICKGMQNILDDPRRDVRKEAVECKTVWLRLDGPDEVD